MSVATLPPPTARRRQPQRWIDAEPVRAHIRGLMAAYRMPIGAILAQTGVAEGTVMRLLYDRRTPSHRILTRIGERLLSAHFDLDVIADYAVINPVGTQRRLQGFAAAGYSIDAIAAELRRPSGILRRSLTRSTVKAGFARAVRDLADRLETVAPSGDPDTVAAVQADARRRGWVRLAAWDDIDDPAATPDVPDRPDVEPDFAVVERILRGARPTRLREVDIYEVVLRLRDRGRGATMLAQLLGCNGTRARRLVQRAALYELMRRLDAAGQLELRFLAHLESGKVHVVVPSDPDEHGEEVSFAEGLAALAEDPIRTLCGYLGHPAARGGASDVDALVERFDDERLCRRCHRALGILAPRAFEHPQLSENGGNLTNRVDSVRLRL